jgi:tetratricopeptide (TPR) repeat protein
MKKLVEDLEDLRHEDPREAECRALAALPDADYEDAARLLGVIGATKRSQEKHEAAFRSIALGIRISSKRGATNILAGLLQKLSYVVADDGRHLDAIEITECALQQFATCGDIHGVGTALVDQGIWLDGAGQIQAAIQAQKSALNLLDPSALRSIFSANQGLANLYLRAKDLNNAEEYALKAIENESAVGPTSRGKLAWVTGRIALARGDVAFGREQMEKAIDIFLGTSTVDAALVGIELVQILLKCGELRTAIAVAGSLRRLIGPLGRNRVAASAIAELGNVELSGATLTASRLQALQRKIRETQLPARAQSARNSISKTMVERN